MKHIFTTDGTFGLTQVQVGEKVTYQNKELVLVHSLDKRVSTLNEWCAYDPPANRSKYIDTGYFTCGLRTSSSMVANFLVQFEIVQTITLLRNDQCSAIRCTR